MLPKPFDFSLDRAQSCPRIEESEDDYRKLADRFVIRRTDPAFWGASDAINDAYAQSRSPDAGLLDLNRLENR